MITGIRPLLRGSTYSGALFAYCGAAASLLLLPLAALPVLAWPSVPAGAQFALTLLVWAVLIGVIGLARTTRRVLIACARRMLKVPLPDPVAVRRPRPADSPDSPDSAPGGDRWRTPVWLLLHVTLGWVGAPASFLLLAAALFLPGGWAGAEAGVSVDGWSLRPEHGWQSWVAAPCCLVLAAVVCLAVTKVLRWLAPRLLGPSAAERLALAAERERQLAERNRLAHELHDSIGHTLTATTIQAAVAGEVLSADPGAARAAMRSIEESTRAALEDLDYVLGVLREEHEEREEEAAAGTAPTRTLADLPELLDRVRYAGAVVEPELSGEWERIQGTLSRAAYRILQEGLTNALRHGADGHPIEVRVVAAPDALQLSVVNRTGTSTGTGVGTGTAPRRAFPTSGHGLPGLAERVRLLHGEIEVGPAGPQHWRLAVRLPVRSSA
ncbi:histidine kinase [Streptomyces sp. UNOC14_S4]|uniref:histidine kinase n=1 Tax=Streptomyces sp. UNOC14_S4 TaxID=2872340 RepID=UPI001E3193A6|nr:histidine kinase [Streptomyces sp. UNOC14_S4]MCC3766714.1 two-component sensor histidine kinase [Streptomyces sp. UNOC14_S4]